jgi:hypothetical protein
VLIRGNASAFASANASANASALLILLPLRWVGLLPFTAPFIQPNFIIF